MSPSRPSEASAAPTPQPPAASGPDDPVAFVDALMQQALAHEATRHRCLLRFERGGYGPRSRDFALSFARWYHGYSAWFPAFLRAVIERLESREHRTLLASNLAEEQGSLGDEDQEALAALGIDPATVDGVPHPELFRRYCAALGLSTTDLATPPIPTIEWRSSLLASLRAGTEAYAVGALGLGTEAVVSTVYAPLVAGLERVEGLERADVVFFELHCHVDDQHYDDLRRIAIDLARSEAGRRDLERGMTHALDLRQRFWDEFERALETSLRFVDVEQEAKGA